MKEILNDTVHLSMSEITQKMFDCKFLSDIQFMVDGKLIYAHSLELMKRSVVFQKHLESTMGEKKIIQITDYKYESFYQFIRFCYTDQCTISDAILFELFKLARHYRVIKLENILINAKRNLNTNLQLFEYSVLHNYEGLRNHLKVFIARDYQIYLHSDTFLNLHVDTVTEMLKMDEIHSDEYDIFEAFVRWMDNYCATNGIDSAERRKLFDKQIKLIRFPTIPVNQLRNLKIHHQNLLTNGDFKTIGSEVTFDYGIEERVWNAERRQPSLVGATKYYAVPQEFQSHFTVNNTYYLSGVRFGNAHNNDDSIEISIHQKLKGANEMDHLTIRQELVPSCDSGNIINFINFGETFMLLPEYLYTLSIVFVTEKGGKGQKFYVYSIRDGLKVACNDPLMGVTFSQESPILIELMVKLTDADPSVK